MRMSMHHMSMMPSTTMQNMPTAMPMADSMSGMMDMGMMMTFNTQNTAVKIFSNAFSPETQGEYVGAWFFCFFLAVGWRALVLLLFKADEHWIRKYSCCEIKTNEGTIQPQKTVQAWRLSTNVPRAILSTVSQGVAYLLMIIVMTMNVGLFFAVLVGYLTGELAFGRVGLHPSAGKTC